MNLCHTKHYYAKLYIHEHSYVFIIHYLAEHFRTTKIAADGKETPLDFSTNNLQLLISWAITNIPSVHVYRNYLDRSPGHAHSLFYVTDSLVVQELSRQSTLCDLVKVLVSITIIAMIHERAISTGN